MNILFLTYDFPYPANSGGKTRAYNLLKYAKSDQQIILFSFTRGEVTDEQKRAVIDIGADKIITEKRRNLKDLRNLRTLFSSNHSIFHELYYDRSVAEKIDVLISLHKIDLIHYESYYTGFYLSESLKKRKVKQIYGSENIEYMLYEQYVEHSVSKLLCYPYKREAEKIKREEEHMMKNADGCLAVTDEEKSIISQLNSKTFTIPNGVDLSFFSVKEKPERKVQTLLFVGNFSYFPNVHGFKFFVDKILPKLSNDSIEILVVGKHFGKLGMKQNNLIRHIEYAEDIRDIYNQADIFISPLNIGGGTNFKILESMASGVPVLAMRKTGASIGAMDGKEIILADGEEDFAQSLRELIKDKKKRGMIAENARRFIEKNYTWGVIGKNLSNFWKSVGNS